MRSRRSRESATEVRGKDGLAVRGWTVRWGWAQRRRQRRRWPQVGADERFVCLRRQAGVPSRPLTLRPRALRHMVMATVPPPTCLDGASHYWGEGTYWCAELLGPCTVDPALVGDSGTAKCVIAQSLQRWRVPCALRRAAWGFHNLSATLVGETTPLGARRGGRRLAKHGRRPVQLGLLVN